MVKIIVFTLYVFCHSKEKMKNNAGCPGEFDVKCAVNGFVS